MNIAIVNDMPLAVEALRRAVALRPEHRVVWVAGNGADAVDRCAQQQPDLVLMDLLMPVMDGVQATREIMSSTPCAILVVTASVDANSARVFEAMGYGALDAVSTPVLGVGDLHATAAPLLTKIDTISKLIGEETRPSTLASHATRPGSVSSRPALIAIGASAGGPAALATVLANLPTDFPAAVVIVQHVDKEFAAGMALWLDQHSALPVRVAEEGDRPLAGAVLLAGTNGHLRFKTSERLGYTREPLDQVYRPSVNVFFESASALWTGDLVGVLLTGMGRDGASGLKALRDKGHHTIAQDQATCAVYGMPKAAAALNAAVEILPIERVAPALADALSRKATSRRTEREVN
jgi:two-component system response regulator WspF